MVASVNVRTLGPIIFSCTLRAPGRLAFRGVCALKRHSMPKVRYSSAAMRETPRRTMRGAPTRVVLPVLTCLQIRSRRSDAAPLREQQLEGRGTLVRTDQRYSRAHRDRSLRRRKLRHPARYECAETAARLVSYRELHSSPEPRSRCLRRALPWR